MPRFDVSDNPIAHDNYAAVVARSDDVRTDAGVVSYTPDQSTDWDGDQDPGHVNDALDQLAERVDDNEGAIASHDHDSDYAPLAHDHAASDITSGTLSDDRIPTKYRTVGHAFYLRKPESGDEFLIAKVAAAATITRISYRTYGSGSTCDFNISIRAEGEPEGAGTDVWSTDKQADTTSEADTSGFNNDAVGANHWLIATVSATSSDPDSLWVGITLEYD